MRDRTSRRIIDAELDRIRRVVACVTIHPVFASGRPTVGTGLTISFREPAPLRLSRAGHVLFDLMLGFGLVILEDQQPQSPLRLQEYWMTVMEPDE